MHKGYCVIGSCPMVDEGDTCWGPMCTQWASYTPHMDDKDDEDAEIYAEYHEKEIREILED